MYMYLACLRTNDLFFLRHKNYFLFDQLLQTAPKLFLAHVGRVKVYYMACVGEKVGNSLFM